MPRISNIEILSLPEQAVLYIRQQTVPSALPDVIGSGYARLADVLEKTGGKLCDVPFMTYCQELSTTGEFAENGCPAALTVELCFPLVAPVAGEDDIRSKVLPAREAAFCMVLGPYDAIGPVYEEMFAWIQARGYAAPTSSSEYYYNGQGYPEEQLLTKLMMPLERREQK